MLKHVLWLSIYRFAVENGPGRFQGEIAALIISKNIWQKMCNTIKKKQSCEVYCLTQPSSKQTNLVQQNVIGYLGYRALLEEKNPHKNPSAILNSDALWGLDFPHRTLKTRFFALI